MDSTGSQPPARTASTVSVFLEGLNAQVEIIRDGRGVPHIRAQDAHDLWFAQGFVHVQDRLWQMEGWRYKSLGRLAEFHGRTALEEDRIARRLRLHESAERDWALYDSETRSLFEAYARGVKAFLKRAQWLPREFEILGHQMRPWTAVDSIAVFKVNHAFMVTWPAKAALARALARFGVERTRAITALYPALHPLMLPPGSPAGPIAIDVDKLLHNVAGLLELAEAGDGSNSWVIDGQRSRSGKPLLAADPHRLAMIPSWYYEQHLISSEIQVTGLTFAGVPGVTHFGHTEQVAFAVTHSYTDTTSLYVERFDREQRRFRYGDGWRDAEIRRERFSIRDEASFEEDVVDTVHGPLVPGPPASAPLALRFTDSGPAKTLTCILPILRAKTVSEMDEALREWHYPCQNFIFADAEGNIGFRLRGRVPVRPQQSAILPLDGGSGGNEWQGWIPFEAMPAVRNPGTHYIVTANNRTVGDEFPYDLGIVAAAGYRAQRITDRLSGYDRCGPEEFSAIQADRYSIPAARLVPWLTGVLKADAGVDKAELDLLRSWDFRVDAESAAAAIYEVWLMRLEDNALRPIFDYGTDDLLSTQLLLRTMLVDQLLAGDTTLLSLGGVDHDWPTVARRSFDEAVSWLRYRLGHQSTAWRWGDIHRLEVTHPLAGLEAHADAKLNSAVVPLEPI